MNSRRHRYLLCIALFAAHSAFAAGTNTVSTLSVAPDVGGSFVRMLAGLAFVLALFFGGVWLFKNWQRVARFRSNSKLNVFEARSLGPRQALYVVGYDEQRFLIAASPAGISLVSSLPEATPGLETDVATSDGASPFAQVLQSVLGRK
jgi:flagellar biogenesis protein FliO